MNQIQLGNTQLYISKQGYGCMGLSEFYGQTDRGEAKDVIKKAIDVGINFFDTADIYGFGDNEILLGEVLSELSDRNKIIVATKCGIVRNKENPKQRIIDNNFEYIINCCKTSIERLGTTIDLYYLHRVIQNDKCIDRAMDAMALLLNENKIKAVGLSEVNKNTLQYAHNRLLEKTNGKHGISAVQSEYSLLTRGVEENGLLDKCQSMNITFVSYSPLSRGILSGKLANAENFDSDDSRRYLPRFTEENLNKNNKINNILVRLAEQKSCSLAQLCLAWLMNKPNVVPIPGTKKIDRMLENVGAQNIILSNQDYHEIDELLVDFNTSGLRYPQSYMDTYGLDF